ECYLRSSFLMFLASASATGAGPLSRLVRLEGLCSSRWFLLARRRITLPEPVTLKRFLAPLCVLVFGMVAVVSLYPGPRADCMGGAPDRRIARWYADAPGQASIYVHRDPAQSEVAESGGRRVAGPGRPSGGALGLLPAGRLLLVRTDHHDHIPPVLLGTRLDEAEFLDVLGEPLQQTVAELRTRLLAPAEHDRDLNLVPGLQEPHHVTLLGLVVVRVDLRTELDLLDDRVRLVLPRLTRLHRGLVLELAVVHELGDGRTRGGRHLD